MINKETYKRLTIHNEQLCNKCIDRKCMLPDHYCKDRFYCEIYNRLAELEDKILSGTLIDTKVKIGQRVFRRGFFEGEIDEYIVSNIILENGKLKVRLKHDFDEHKTCYSATVLGIEEIGKTVFLTRAEAENET